jgi:hypothetical protein
MAIVAKHHFQLKVVKATTIVATPLLIGDNLLSISFLRSFFLLRHLLRKFKIRKLFFVRANEEISIKMSKNIGHTGL